MQIMQFLISNFHLVTYVLVCLGSVLELGCASTPSQIQLEANAIMNSGWWHLSPSHSHHICSWIDGISCNAAGSVTRITYNYSERPIQLATLNLSVFKNLKHLELSHSNLEGSIPSQIGNLSNLRHLDLSSNSLHGETPFTIGKLSKLIFLDLSFNSLQGQIPFTIGNIFRLTYLNLAYNDLQGEIPSSVGYLSKLTYLKISSNSLQGQIPPSIGNLSKLTYFDLSYNSLQGEIPSSVRYLSKLTYLKISDNSLQGQIPPSIGNLSKLTYFDLSYNSLQGEIPPSIGNLSKLTYFDLSYNSLQGEIPSSVRYLSKLTYLEISGNSLQDQIPPSIGNLSKLTYLDLSSNYLQGKIPLTIGNISKLTYLDFSNNSLQGQIPLSLGHLTQLLSLSISNNNIEGPIPSQLSLIRNLSFLNLSFNKINGTFPTSLSNFINIQYLDISHNLLTGSLKPFSVEHLRFFETLDLSYNNFTGPIPESLNASNVNLSFNNLSGPIPYGLDPYGLRGNEGVCSNNLSIQIMYKFQPCSVQDKKLRQNQLVIILSITIILIMAFFLLLYLRHNRIAIKSKRSRITETSNNGDLFCIWNYDGSIAYEDIITVTEDFDLKYCIGTGAYGSVYRAQLPSGKIVAVKKLHGFEAEVPSFDESFRNEAKVLSEIKHRHIVKLHGFCLHKRIMFLIYEYMERGSLFSVLFDDMEAMELDWKKRINIVKGTAHALSYLHHDCVPPIVHRDISASNVLLNSMWEPTVSDFGTARFLNLDSSNRTIVAGTIGYIAPGKILHIFLYI